MISAIKPLTHEQLPGIAVFPLDAHSPTRGVAQRVLVQMAPGARIKPHRHSVDATMDVVYGCATVLSDDEDNGVVVQLGKRVHFDARGLHGFEAGPEGFAFLSTNDGIVDEHGNWDIEFVAA